MAESGIRSDKDLHNQLTAGSGIWEIGSAQNIGARKQQQDSIGQAEGIFQGKPALLAILADGMGGMADGAEFSRIAVEAHITGFQSTLDRYSDPAHVLLSLAVDSNTEANKIYDPNRPGGTTLVTALCIGDEYWFLSVGDSRINLIRKNTTLQLNRDHVFGTILDERAWMGVIAKEDALGSTLRDKLSSSVGEPSIRKIDLSDRSTVFLPGDRLVLMSDGIYRSVSEEEMLEEMGKTPQEAADAIVQRVLGKAVRGQDNLSLIIVEKK